ncbi:MAG: PilN domain-containing protein [Actinomycetota bacterium]
MRPVNLIPPEERRGEAAPIRTGPVAYLIVGALAAVLAAVTFVVFTGNQISDREARVAELKDQEASAKARAESLAAFAEFHTVQEQRTATIRSLADSRFDWERVMRELALVMPNDVWLTGLNGTVASGVNVGDAVSIADRAEVAGPALELIGCARGQESVAEFLAALEDIDGVTRVGLVDSQLPGAGESASPSSSTSGATDTDCRTRDFIARFQVIAAFDAVPPPAVPGAAPTAPAPGEPAPAPSAGKPTAPASDSSGVAETRQQEAAGREDVKKGSQESREAVNLIPGS